MALEDIPRTDEEVFDNIADELLVENSDANPRSSATFTYALILALARTIASNHEVGMQDIYDASFVATATGDDLTEKARNLGVVRRNAIPATGVVTFSRSNSATTDYTIPSGTIVETLENDPIQFETTETVTLSSGTTSVDATVEALEGGSEGNVGPNSIQAMPSPPTGVEEVTNSEATGDPSNTDTNGDPLVEGRDREDDTALRRRVFDTNVVADGPSAGGIEQSIEGDNGPDGVVSAHVNVNATGSTSNGLDPYHTEVVVFGGDSFEVAEAISESMSVTTLLRLQGGVNGSSVSETVHVRLLDQDVTVPFTRPSELTFDVNIDVVHTNAYDGDVTVKDTIVEYVGGTFDDDATTTGIGLGENVLVNEIENRVEDVAGVDYADVTLIDEHPTDSNDDTTTDSDGVPILSVADSEVARVDADNITVNTTAR